MIGRPQRMLNAPIFSSDVRADSAPPFFPNLVDMDQWRDLTAMGCLDAPAIVPAGSTSRQLYGMIGSSYVWRG